MIPRYNQIPNGWYRVTEGKAHSGDKYWDEKFSAWLPVVCEREIGNLIIIRRF
jgi:hypothetical protein